MWQVYALLAAGPDRGTAQREAAAMAAGEARRLGRPASRGGGSRGGTRTRSRRRSPTGAGRGPAPRRGDGGHPSPPPRAAMAARLEGGVEGRLT